MFKRLIKTETIEVTIDGESVHVSKGVTVAAALLLSNAVPVRHSLVDGSPRAPYCMMGVCAECLVIIDGQPGQFACQRTVQPGMEIKRTLSTDSGAQ